MMFCLNNKKYINTITLFTKCLTSPETTIWTIEIFVCKPEKYYDNMQNFRLIKKIHGASESAVILNLFFRVKKFNLAHAGLEPATFALLARRSNQLS
jgi:hypothetical protein